MNEDSPERQAARDAVDKAVRAYVIVCARENGITDDPIVLGWAGFAEYTSISLEAEDSSGNCNLIPDGQSAAMSRGLMGFGADAFSRAVMR